MACGALARCGTDTADGGTDAAPDHGAADVLDAGAADSPVICNDASQGTRWAGWSRLTEADPCCTVEVPDQVDASVDPLTWVPCTNDAGGCEEMPITWGVQPNWTRFNSASVAPTDQPRTVLVGRRLDTNLEEFDAYSFASGTPLAAWRDYVTTDTVWTAEPFPANQSAWVFVSGSRDVNVAGESLVAYSASLTLSMHPIFNVVPASALKGSVMQDFGASDGTLAFDIEPAGKIGRVSASAPGNFVFSDGGSSLINPLVHADDVLAESSYGNNGWAEEFRIDPTGNAIVIRARTNEEVSNFASDSSTVYWTESYGGSGPGLSQPTTEVWSAPYTSDPTTLDSTGKKLALANGANAYGNNAIAFGGYFAIITGPGQATVVRGSDGAVQQVGAGPGRAFTELVYVSATEVWALMRDPNINAPGAEFFQREQLAAWP